MIDRIKQFLFGTPKKKGTNFFDLPSRDKKRIMMKAGRHAQAKQKELLDRYDAKFGNVVVIK